MIRGYLRFIILKILGEEPLTGYSLMQRIGSYVGTKPSPGSVYPLLKTLEEEGLILREPKKKGSIYKLTSRGHSTLKKLQQQKNLLIQKIRESFKLLRMMSISDLTQEYEDLLLSSITRDVPPFEPVVEDLLELKKILLEFERTPKDKKKVREIQRILRETNKKLRSILK